MNKIDMSLNYHVWGGMLEHATFAPIQTFSRRLFFYWRTLYSSICMINSSDVHDRMSMINRQMATDTVTG